MNYVDHAGEGLTVIQRNMALLYAIVMQQCRFRNISSRNILIRCWLKANACMQKETRVCFTSAATPLDKVGGEAYDVSFGQLPSEAEKRGIGIA